jgi:methylmalonyl-CoA mutase N-terminal domain/subunit
MRDAYAATNPASWKLRFHAQTAGCTLQEQQPEVNLIRVAYQALAAVLGGCQSLHTNSMDETIALPTEHAVTLALRTQQVLAYETGVTSFVDPLGGSELVESMTCQMHDAAIRYFEQIASAGGMQGAIQTGFFRREIAEAAYAEQQEVDRGERVIVGVNRFVEPPGEPLEVMEVDMSVESEQIESLRRVKSQRSSNEVAGALSDVRRSASTGENIFPALLAAAQARATVGEIMSAMADIFGRHSLREQ